MSLVTLKTELRQELRLTPQLLQSMEILQMNSQELLEYLQKAAEENPVLEQEESAALSAAYAELRQRASWIDGGIPGATFSHEGTEYPEAGQVDRETESLTAFLCDQLERLRLDKPLLALCRYLAQFVDEDGYLAQEDLVSLSELKIPSALTQQALATLQSLEPAGVAARDLSECLTLQLKRQTDVPPYVLDIARHHLTDLSRGHYGPIVKALGVTPAQIQDAERRIAALDPRPGGIFQSAEPVVYVRPDVFVVELDGTLQVVLNEYYLPRISVSSYYATLLKTSNDPDTHAYLTEKMQQAKSLLSSLERRGSTLQRCAQAVLDTQRPFFEGVSRELSPMTLTTLAEVLELHPSTVSRAMRDKYLQCRQGTFPMRFFFSRPVGNSARQTVQQRIKALIGQEDPAHPLSDQTLCDLLAEDGITVSRRAVAKYRMVLGIGSSTVRKQKSAGSPAEKQSRT